MDTRHTPSGVRVRRHSTSEGSPNWLLLPGGPGLGSESLHELADAMDVPGTIWLVDLPGDGSNPAPQDDNPFAAWPQVLAEAAAALSDAVYVGHSTGGMYLLATPQLQDLVRGLVLLDTAPDCTWHADFVAMTQGHPLPGVERAADAYAQEKSIANLRALTVCCAEWNFAPPALEAGRALLARMPYNFGAVDWSDAHFDHTYQALWWPDELPVLRLWGDSDQIVSQHAWEAARYNGPNVTAHAISHAGHFPWIDNPAAVTEAFRVFSRRVLAS